MKILSLADLHLGRNRGELSCFDTEDCEYAIKQLSKIYEENKIDYTIIAGDIVNGTSINDEEQHLLALFKNVLNKYQKNKVFIIRGNHDRARYDTMEEMFGFIQLTETPVNISKFHTISGCNYRDKETHLNYLKTNTADILVCHLPMGPFSTFSADSIPASECQPDKIVIVGDTHKPGVFSSHGGLVISVGCLFPKDKSEILSGYAGYACILELNESIEGLDTVGVLPTPLKKRFGADLTRLSTYSDISEAIDTIRASKTLNTDLTPVLYVSNPIYKSLVDSDDFTDFKFFGVPVCENSMEPEEELANLETLDTIEIIKKTVSNLFTGDPKRTEITELTRDLIITDDPRRVIQDFIKK